MAFNKYQTSIEDLHLEDYPQEVVEEFYDALNSVQYIKNLVSDKRPLMSELPRDEQGRAIIDLANPPIFENVDYFRQTALKFKKDGKFTDLRPNANPNSEYGKWMKQEVERCWYGMTREEDGAWVNGDMYFYLNYVPIVQTLIIEGTQMADRIVDFPEFWEGIWWRSIYIEMARKNGRHAAEIAKRGASKSYFVASILAKLFTIGENKNTSKRVRGMVMAYQKEYLVKDGTLNKFEEMKDFLAENTQWPYKTLTSSLDKMQWVMGYKDLETNAKKGTGNEIIGISAKDDPDKGRGKRSSKIIIEEFGNFPKITDTYRVMLPSVQEGDIAFGQMILIGCVCAGTKVYTADGTEVPIENLYQHDGILGYDLNTDSISIEPITYMKKPCLKPCVRIKTKNRILECSIDHPILTRTVHSKRIVDYKVGNNRTFNYEYSFVEAGKLTGKNNQGIVVCEAPRLNFGNINLEDPYLIGLLIGDGSYGFNKTPVLSNCDEDILKYVENKYNCVTEKSKLTKDNKLYKEIRIKGICKMLRKCGIYGQTKANKRLPLNYKYLSQDSASKLLAGLFDTDGSIPVIKKKYGIITLTSSSNEMLQQVQELLIKFGIKSNISEINAKITEGRKDKNNWFTLHIVGRGNILRFKKYIPIKVKYKIKNLDVFCEHYNDSYNYTNNTVVEKIISVEDIGMQEVYNLTAGNTHTYLANDIITHNTGGSEGADFAGAMEIIYNPLGYNIQPVQNVYDKAQQGKSQCIFFFSACVNRKGCYNHDGISDITKALLEICHNRYIVKYNTSDPMALTRTKAENPITLQEAIMKRDGSMFPVAQLVDRIDQLKQNHSEYDDVYVGELTLKSDGTVGFKPTNDQPIRFFPHNNNKLKGAIEIFEMPQKDQNDKVFGNRYILSCDPYDDDTSQTLSLGSVFVLDLWQDKIVAEYTGRPQFADEFYEIARRMCIFYNGKMNYENNKKGIFAYFKQMNSLYLLTQTFEYLKDRDDTKNQLIGNKAWGTPATEGINYYGRTLLRDWLLKPFTEIHKEGNEDVEVTIPNLMRIRNLALLIELSQWNPDGNFDRVSSMIMMMLYRQDRMIVMGGDLTGKKQQQARKDYIGNDDYFTRNYDNRFNVTIQFNESN